MAVPKKRTGSSAQGHRRSNWKATVPETTVCKNCGELVLTHTVCSKCGTYKGKVVSIKAEGYVAEETKPVKKATKKASKPKKAEVETTVEPEVKEETVVEEVKAEETPAQEVAEAKEDKTEE